MRNNDTKRASKKGSKGYKKSSHNGDKSGKINGSANTKQPSNAAGSMDREEAVKGKLYNDPSWRMYNDLIGNQVAAFPLLTFVGGQPNEKVISSEAVYSTRDSVEGNFNIATVLLNPSVGYANSTFDAINQAALKMYTQFSSTNMKTTQYAPQDIIACILALGQVISIGTYIKRAIGFAGTTNPRNWLYPKAIVGAMGINWDDLQANIGIYREQYNYTCALLGAVAFPKNLEYFQSMESIYREVFLDHTTGMAQTYVPVPSSTWILNEISSEEGSVLDTFKMPYVVNHEIKPVNLSTVLETWSSMIDTLLQSATLQYLYADVLKYVSNSEAELVRMPFIEDGFSQIPVYSEEFLVNIENCVVMGEPTNEALEDVGGVVGSINTTSNNVYLKAGNNTVRYEPAFYRALTTRTSDSHDLTYMYNPVLNFHTDNPDTKARIMAARFVPAVVRSIPAKNADGTVKVVAFNFQLPDMYVVDVIFHYRGYDVASGKLVDKQDSWLDGQAFKYRDLEVFAHPIRVISGEAGYESADNAKIRIPRANLYGEIDVYTTVDTSTMRRMQELAILSLFSLK